MISVVGPACTPQTPNVLTRVDYVSSWVAGWIAATEAGGRASAGPAASLPAMTESGAGQFAIYTLFGAFGKRFSSASKLSGDCRRASKSRFSCEIVWIARRTVYAGTVTPFYVLPAADDHLGQPLPGSLGAAALPQQRLQRRAAAASTASAANDAAANQVASPRDRRLRRAGERRRGDRPDRRGDDRAQGRRPLPRRRRLRGDPPLRGQAVRAGRPPRPAGALGRRRSSSSFDRGALESEIEALLGRAGAGRRPAAADRHPRRPPDRRHRADPRTTRDARPRHRHLLPERDPQRGQVALLRGEHAGDPDRERQGRRRGGPDPPRRHRARAADLVGLLGLRRGRAADPGARPTACSSRSPATG